MVRIQAGEEGMSPYERGRHRYKQADYTGALEAFNEAVESSDSHLLLNALDSRAATFEKLGKLQPAYEDAKTMIKTLPKLSKGYLRMGKILQLQGRSKIALDIYERGLTKVNPTGDKERGFLQKMANKLRLAQGQGTSHDLLDLLPPELVLEIFRYLDINSRNLCLGVNKHWNAYLLSVPFRSLWTTLDTTFARKEITHKWLRRYLKRSQWTIDRAIVTLKARFDTKRLSYIMEKCRQLNELQVHGAGLMGHTLEESLHLSRTLKILYISRATEIPLRSAQKIIGGCAGSLVSVTILNITGNPGGYLSNRWPKGELIKTLNLRSGNAASLDIRGLINSYPSVTSAILPDWIIMPLFVDYSPWTTIEHLDITNGNVSRFPRLPSSLKHLILNGNGSLGLGQNEEVPSLPMLETLGCAGTEMDSRALETLTSASIKAGNLKKLDIGNLSHFSSAAAFTASRILPVGEQYPASKTLEELSLASNQLINDKQIAQIIELYPNLERLDVSATKVTGVAVRHAVDSGIKYLNLDECTEVGSDAVGWARSKGVEVQFNFPSRRIRAATFRDAGARGSFEERMEYGSETK